MQTALDFDTTISYQDITMRILADLPDTDIRWLDDRAAELGRSRASLLREAVSAYRDRERDWLMQGFGLWTKFGKGVDGSTFESAARSAWSADDAVSDKGRETA